MGNGSNLPGALTRPRQDDLCRISTRALGTLLQIELIFRLVRSYCVPHAHARSVPIFLNMPKTAYHTQDGLGGTRDDWGTFTFFGRESTPFLVVSRCLPFSRLLFLSTTRQPQLASCSGSLSLPRIEMQDFSTNYAVSRWVQHE